MTFDIVSRKNPLESHETASDRTGHRLQSEGNSTASVTSLEHRSAATEKQVKAGTIPALEIVGGVSQAHAAHAQAKEAVHPKDSLPAAAKRVGNEAGPLVESRKKEAGASTGAADSPPPGPASNILHPIAAEAARAEKRVVSNLEAIPHEIMHPVETAKAAYKDVVDAVSRAATNADHAMVNTGHAIASVSKEAESATAFAIHHLFG